MYVTIIDGPARHLGRVNLRLKASQASILYRDGVTIAGTFYRRVSGSLGDQTLSSAPVDRRIR